MSYRRIILSGTLTTKEDLHIGSGEESQTDQGSGSENLLFTDYNGLPLIPASTLRGFLRAQLAVNKEMANLFGTARQRVDENSTQDDYGSIGMVRVYDARLDASTFTPSVLTRTSIDPVSGAALQNHLASHQIIPPNSHFKVNLEIDHCGDILVTDDHILAILQAFSSFENSPAGQIGKGKSIGQGGMSWQLSTIKTLSNIQLVEWLVSGLNDAGKLKTENKPTKKIRRYRKNNSAENTKAIRTDTRFKQNRFEEKTDYFKALLNAQAETNNKWKAFPFSLISLSPLLINDPQLVKKTQIKYQKENKRNEGNNKKEDVAPTAMYMRRDKKARIPGSTLKGWLRAHCRRILLTLTQNPDQDTEVTALLNILFGSTKNGMGCLKFSDVFSEEVGDNQVHQQTFNAVDRFTGGVKPSALYSAEAVCSIELSGKMSYHKECLPGWGRLLLLYALRDAMQGDLTLGWGKSKGYGRLKLTQQNITFNQYSEATLSAWQAELFSQLGLEQAA